MRNINKIYCFFIFGFETRDAIYPKKIAEAIPPAAAFVPPVKAPIILFEEISDITPFDRRFPKPVRGTVAPHPAKSIKYWYIPIPPKIAPKVT